jgi:hypothetical protein
MTVPIVLQDVQLGLPTTAGLLASLYNMQATQFSLFAHMIR